MNNQNEITRPMIVLMIVLVIGYFFMFCQIANADPTGWTFEVWVTDTNGISKVADSVVTVDEQDCLFQVGARTVVLQQGEHDAFDITKRLTGIPGKHASIEMFIKIDGKGGIVRIVCYKDGVKL